MALVVQFEERARQELEALRRRYGPEFGVAHDSWLARVVSESQSGVALHSHDALPELRAEYGQERIDRACRVGFARWRRTTWGDRFRAIGFNLRGLTTWEYRYVSNVMELHYAPEADPPSRVFVIRILYEIDRAKNQFRIYSYTEPRV
jgi:hypothetical protein